MTARRVRILLVTTSMAGGAGLYAYQLARDLDRTRFDLRLAFGPGYPLDRTIADGNLPHHLLRWSRNLDPIRIVSGTVDLVQLLRREPVDILHAQCSLAGAIGRPLGRLFRVPHVVFTCHAFASRDYQPAWRKRTYLAIERAMDAYTDRYFASSNAIRDLLVTKRIADAKRVTVIPQGIDIPPPPTPQARQAAREALAADPADLVVVWAGRLEEQKGLTYLLRAWPRVVAAVPRARLVLLGDGPLRGSLQAEAERLGIAATVQFLGWRDDVAVLMPGADVFCLPSLWESFGYVLLEAMAAGVPVVASAVEGIPEVVGDQCGILVPPADPSRLTDALVEALRDSARRAAMARAARIRVEREFTVEQMVGRFENAYDDLLR